MPYYRNRFRENIFITLIFIYILEYELVGLVLDPLIDKIIKIGSLILLLILFPKIKGGNNKNPNIKKVINIYFFFFLLMFISCLLNPGIGTYIGFFKFFMVFLVLLILLYYLHPYYFSDSIIKFPILIGVILSIHSIVLWLLVYYGVEIDYKYVTNERTGRVLTPYNPFWGDMIQWAWGSGLKGMKSRAVGFFYTPDRYGSFLQYPAFIGFGYYILTKRFIYLIASILCFLTIFLTFSAGAIFSTIAVICASIVIKNLFKIKQLKKSIILVSVIGFLAATTVLVGIHSYIKDKLISAGGEASGEIYYKVAQYDTIFHSLAHENFSKPEINKPFGKGFVIEDEEGNVFMNQYAIERWINIGGLPIVILFLIYFYYMYKVYVLPVFVDKSTGIKYYVALVYVGQTVMQFQHGAWWNASYFYTTAILILLKTYNFRKEPQINLTAASSRVLEGNKRFT